MEKKLREIINEPTFGDKMTPILSEIEDAIIERKLALPNDIPCYGKLAIMSAITIFTDVLLDLALPYWEKLGLTNEQMWENARKIGEEIRLMVFRYGDTDTTKLKNLDNTPGKAKD